MRQASARIPLFSSWSCLTLVLLLVGSSGCHKEEVTSYSAPKESAPSSVPGMPSPAGGAVAGARPIQWTAPAGWTEQPASAMRVGSFVLDKDGQHAEIS